MTELEVTTLDAVRGLRRARDLLLAKLDGDGPYREVVGETITEIERAMYDDNAALAVVALVDALSQFGHCLSIAATRPSDQVTCEEAVRIAYRTLARVTVTSPEDADV